METTIDHGQHMLDRIASLEIERARIEAEIASEMLEFADLRRRESERHADPRLRDLESDFAADELSVVVKEPTRIVQCRLAESRRVRGRLPLTWEAFAAGRIDERRIRLIASAVDKLSDNYSTITLDHWVVDYAAAHTASQLRGWLRRFVARNATDTRAARTEREKRSVWLSHQDDGMTFLSAYIPTPDAIRLDTEITRLAKAEPTDGRTLEQKRADEGAPPAGLPVGESRAACSATARRPRPRSGCWCRCRPSPVSTTSPVRPSTASSPSRPGWCAN